MKRVYIMGRYEVVQTPDNQFWVRSLEWGWKTGNGLVKPSDNNTYNIVETFLDYKTAERFTDKLACSSLIIKEEQENDIELITSLLCDPHCSDQDFVYSCKTLGLNEKEREGVSKLPKEQSVKLVIKIAIARNSIVNGSRSKDKKYITNSVNNTSSSNQDIVDFIKAHPNAGFIKFDFNNLQYTLFSVEEREEDPQYVNTENYGITEELLSVIRKGYVCDIEGNDTAVQLEIDGRWFFFPF